MRAADFPPWPSIVMNTTSIARLLDVYPPLSVLIRQLASQLPFDIEVTQALRTWEEQDALYAQGRTQPGAIVTYAPGGFSWHNFGLAVDLVPEDLTPGQPDWNLSNPVWARMVSAAESLGLVSGSEWPGAQQDWPHLQMTGRFPASPDDEVRRIYSVRGSFEDVWNAAFSAPEM